MFWQIAFVVAAFFIGTLIGNWYWQDKLKALSRIGVAISGTEVLVVKDGMNPVRFSHDGSGRSIDQALRKCMNELGNKWE
jgi:hypothetical protein